MKKVLIITLSLLSASAFATGSAQSNSGLNGDLIQKMTASGLSTDEAVKAVATGQIKQGQTIEQLVEDKK